MDNQTELFQSLELRRDRLHEQIADSIQDMIAEDQLQPGARLPPERDLAKVLGVNRATLREAIRSLQQRGLVEMKVGSGTFITSVPPAVVAETIERFLVFGTCSHEELMTVRAILEPEIAALAAQHATAEDLSILQALVEQIEDAFVREEVANYAAADVGFHEALAAATHNDLISALTQGLEKVMKTWILAQTETRRLEQGAYGHRPICESVVAGDPDGAREAMHSHIILTRRAFIEDAS
jgi:GntR family transcriptional repressor for pyruvate dehydrogenase complex